MDIVKKNLVSFICGGVALLALVAIYLWPLDGYFDALKAKADARAARYSEINTLMTRRRNMPTFDFDTAKSPELGEFPTKPIIDLGKSSLDSIKKESEKMYDTAVEMNRSGRGLVYARTLPKPATDSIALAFRSKLQEALDQLRLQVLNAGIPPTAEEIQRRTEELAAEYEKKYIKVQGEIKNKAQVDALFVQEAVKLPEKMQKEMATNKKMYVNPSEVMKAPAYLPTREPADEAQIWWAQVEYWITKDVVDAIAAMNTDAKNVQAAPLKNLVSLVVQPNFYPPPSASPAAGGAGVGGFDRTGSAGADQPQLAAPDPKVAVPESAAQGPTKRISNPLYDVCRFNLSVDIEAQRVPQFIRLLTMNRFLSVLRFDITAVDSQLRQIEGYVYGDRPVVRLELEGEALFMRKWTLPLMPEKVKKQLIPDTPKPQD